MYFWVKCYYYSSICHERPPPVRSESGPSWQVASGYRDINTANTAVGTLQMWPAKAGGRSPKGPAVAGTTVEGHTVVIRPLGMGWVLIRPGSKDLRTFCTW